MQQACFLWESSSRYWFASLTLYVQQYHMRRRRPAEGAFTIKMALLMVLLLNHSYAAKARGLNSTGATLPRSVRAHLHHWRQRISSTDLHAMHAKNPAEQDEVLAHPAEGFRYDSTSDSIPAEQDEVLTPPVEGFEYDSTSKSTPSSNASQTEETENAGRPDLPLPLPYHTESSRPNDMPQKVHFLILSYRKQALQTGQFQRWTVGRFTRRK